MALTIARRYTDGAIFSCPDGAEVCNMFEKYNVNDIGSAGGGGKNIQEMKLNIHKDGIF